MLNATELREQLTSGLDNLSGAEAHEAFSERHSSHYCSVPKITELKPKFRSHSRPYFRPHFRTETRWNQKSL